MTRMFRSIVFVSLLAPMMFAAVPAAAAADAIGPFVGRYIGKSLSSAGDDVSARDFDVSIEAVGKGGFEVSWTTFIHRDDGTVKKKESAIGFRKTRVPGVYASMQKTDMFGNQVPHDPMEGEPYVWAQIDGPTLSVHGFLVMDSGAWEVQTYRRTLTETGMNLVFTRARESGVVRQISGVLQRVEE